MKQKFAKIMLIILLSMAFIGMMAGFLIPLFVKK